MLRISALASVIANIVIVVTGGVVRLTGSGLGCPTWPRCTDGSYVTTPAMGVHGMIEFGNRSLSFLVGTIALIGVILAYLSRRERPAAWRAALVVLAGVAAQGVLGGITVHTALNPWTVAAHFLLSMVLIAVAYNFWRSTGTERARWAAPGPVRALGLILALVSGAVLVLGTLVSGSGPHAGDQKAARTGFDPGEMAQLHADGVFLLLGLTVAAWFAMRLVDAPVTARRAVLLLLTAELAQGVVGFVQYFTHLPAGVVMLHLLGACLVWLATCAVVGNLRSAPEPAANAVVEQRQLASLAG